MTKFAAFSLVLFVLVISSIYKVNSAPQYDLYPQYTAEPGGFRALGVNYNYMSYFYYSIFIISAMLNQ